MPPVRLESRYKGWMMRLCLRSHTGDDMYANNPPNHNLRTHRINNNFFLLSNCKTILKSIWEFYIVSWGKLHHILIHKTTSLYLNYQFFYFPTKVSPRLKLKSYSQFINSSLYVPIYHFCLSINNCLICF